MNLKHAGVYQITCIPSGNVYIGSSVALDRRLREHKRELRIGTHYSSYMQNSWNKYGPDAFEFKVLVICEKDMTLFYEQIFLDALEPKFNTAKIAGSNAGIARSDETKKRMSKAQRNSRKKYEWKGQMLCLTDIAEMEGVNANQLIGRVVGYDRRIEDAINTPIKQQVHILTYDGKTQALMQWAEELGVHPQRIRSRLAKGMEFPQIVEAIHGMEKRLSLQEFCRLSGVGFQVTLNRMNKGMSMFEAITKPLRITKATKHTTWEISENG